jgi:hypothetical protein
MATTATPAPADATRKHTKQEVLEMLRAARTSFQATNAQHRDVLAEFLAERRATAVNE